MDMFPLIFFHQNRLFSGLSKCLSHIQLSVTPRTVTHQAPLSMEFSRQEYWSGLPFPPPGHLPDPGIKPVSYRQILYHLSHQGGRSSLKVKRLCFVGMAEWLRSLEKIVSQEQKIKNCKRNLKEQTKRTLCLVSTGWCICVSWGVNQYKGQMGDTERRGKSKALLLQNILDQNSFYFLFFFKLDSFYLGLPPTFQLSLLGFI